LLKIIKEYKSVSSNIDFKIYIVSKA